MTLRTAIYNAIAAVANITDVVSTRIYWVVMPQGTVYPAITFETLPVEGRVHLMGADSTLVMEEFRVTIWGQAKNFTGMETLAGYIQTLFEGFKGTLGGVGGITVDWIYLDTNDPTFYDSGAEVYRISQDFTIWYQEA